MVSYCPINPSPTSLIESLRGVGYSMATAVADIVDNSIAAFAKNIDVKFSWNSGTPWVAIVDNGEGMLLDVLQNAMRFGSTSPCDRRAITDLGRFGLGMKTAAFSQCRCLTVLSKVGSAISCCQWDLDRLKPSEEGWNLAVYEDFSSYPAVIKGCYEQFLSKEHAGTIVLLERVDRFTDGEITSKQEKAFNRKMAELTTHLSLVFHRYISPCLGEGKKIFMRVNGALLEAVDPFNSRSVSTCELPEEVISSHGEKIVIQPYVLPHHNKIPQSEYDKYAGAEGYLQNQGFYVYRNRRLIIKGTWFRLIKRAELTKLVRVRIDLPNSLDSYWKIDIKKSHASPPELVRIELKRIIEKISAAGKRVYRQRGQSLIARDSDPVWLRTAKQNNVAYEINIEHQLVDQFLVNLPVSSQREFKNLLYLIQESFPKEQFYHDYSQLPDHISNTTLATGKLCDLVDSYVELWGGYSALSREDIDELLSMRLFMKHTEVVLKMLSARGVVYE